MEPIIDPMVFYWISVAQGAKGLAVLFVAIFMIATVFATISNYDEVNKKLKRWWPQVILTGCFVLSLLVATAIPSEETCNKMLIAKYATRETIQQAKEEGKDIVRFLVDEIKRAQKDSDKE